MPINLIGRLYGVNGETLRKLYKYKLSGYTEWEGMRLTRYSQTPYIAFPENCGPNLSIDETALSKDELFTIITNKDAHGGPGTLVAMLYGTKVADIVAVLEDAIPIWKRLRVKEVTCDLSSAMMESARISFPQANITNDRFHVQQLFNEAMDELRIDIRHQVRKDEAAIQEMCRMENRPYSPMKARNGVTWPQILVRSKKALMTSANKWSIVQKQRIEILFEYYPELEQAFNVMQELRNIFNMKVDHLTGGAMLMKWFENVKALGREHFNTVIRTFKNNFKSITNYFHNRATNASAESFNAKIKMFRTQLKGVADPLFFIFRLCKLFA